MVGKFFEVEDVLSSFQKPLLDIEEITVLALSKLNMLLTCKNPVGCYLPTKELFDVIESSHIAVGHGGRNHFKVKTSRKYAKIHSVNIFCLTVETARKKKKLAKKRLVSKPILHA